MTDFARSLLGFVGAIVASAGVWVALAIMAGGDEMTTRLTQE